MKSARESIWLVVAIGLIAAVAIRGFLIWPELTRVYTASSGPEHFVELLEQGRPPRSTPPIQAQLHDSLYLQADRGFGEQYLTVEVEYVGTFPTDLQGFVERFAARNAVDGANTKYGLATLGKPSDTRRVLALRMVSDDDLGPIMSEFCEALAVYGESEEWTYTWENDLHGLDDAVNVRASIDWIELHPRNW